MIFDLNDNPLHSGQLEMPPDASTTLQIRIDCRPAYFLSATAAADLSIAARRVGDTEWTNIETGSLSLSPYAGTRTEFEIRLTSGTATAITRNLFSLRVSR